MGHLIIDQMQIFAVILEKFTKKMNSCIHPSQRKVQAPIPNEPLFKETAQKFNECIIEDSRPFGDFRKPGMRKFLHKFFLKMLLRSLNQALLSFQKKKEQMKLKISLVPVALRSKMKNFRTKKD